MAVSCAHRKVHLAVSHGHARRKVPHGCTVSYAQSEGVSWLYSKLRPIRRCHMAVQLATPNQKVPNGCAVSYTQ